jgi:hypothetical protein
VAVLLILGTTTLGFSQVEPAQPRIPQQVVINGQTVNGAYVQVPGGGLQSFTCSNPQHYSTPDGGMKGWACFDAATDTWLLNAVPPASAQAAPVPVPSRAPAVIY